MAPSSKPNNFDSKEVEIEPDLKPNSSNLTTLFLSRLLITSDLLLATLQLGIFSNHFFLLTFKLAKARDQESPSE